MKNAALAGETFPEIIADRASKRIVSGLHRKTLYEQLYGADYETEIDLRDFADENEMFLVAVAENAAHGMGYSTYDRRKILVEAERRGIAKDVIASAIKMPVTQAEKRLVDGSAFVKTAAGGRERVALHTSMKPLHGQDLTQSQEDANSRSGMKTEYHVESLILLLRSNVLQWGSKKSKAAILSLHEELTKHITA
jgi:hypothetical protein